MTTSAGVEDDIMAKANFGVGQRATKRIYGDLGGGESEAHVWYLHLNVQLIRLDRLRWGGVSGTGIGVR